MTVRRFPDRPAVWQDDDRRPFGPAPEKFYSPFFWDAMDNAFFRGAAEVWTFPVRGRARNVNALDEVPDSSWFVNRIGRHPMTPREVATGPCADEPVDPDDPVPKPWRIVAGKPDGLNPGFTIESADGRRHLLKTDGDRQVDRPTAADVIGSRLYHAVGYHVPCNRIVYFTRDDVTLAEGAEVRRTTGRTEPMTPDHVEEVLEAASPLPDGVYRASTSAFLPGEPIGPWRYWGTDADDGNDVFDHRDRREVRGLYVMAAWTDHVDSRQENTLRTWHPTPGRDDGTGSVTHWVIDFGDCFGLLSNIEGLSPRLGYSGYFDLEHVVGDFFTLGLLDRPWDHARLSEAGVVLAYYDAERFKPDGWRGGYPNPAFEARGGGDEAWMARILSRFEPNHLRAAVREGRLDATSEAVLLRVLAARRRKLLERFLTERSPLSAPRLVRRDAGPWALCAEDRLVASGLRALADRRLGARLWRSSGGRDAPLEDAGLRPAEAFHAVEPATFCVDLPGMDDPGGTDGYAVVDLAIGSPGRDRPGPLRVHVLRGPAPRVLGVERPERSDG